MPTAAELAAWLAEPSTLVAIGALVAAGLVRGLTGFGAAMVFIPVASAVFGAQVAVPMMLIIDGIMAMPQAVLAARTCNWREVLPLFLGSAVTLPLGVWVLKTADQTALRWAISILVLVAASVLASGWRYRKPPSLPATAAIGGVSGFFGGAVSLYGPAIVLFWLGGQGVGAAVRGNIFAFFGLASIASALVLGANGLMTAPVAAQSLVLMPVYGVGLWAGSRLFRLASEAAYRRLALAIIFLATLMTLPVWH
jgi:uncharacterized protein